MERIEVNVQTGEMQIIQLTDAEISAAQEQYKAWQANQQQSQPDLTILELQTQLATLTDKLNEIQNKVGV